MRVVVNPSMRGEFLFINTYNKMYRLTKEEKLCSRTRIELLFAEGKSFAQYPLRIVYRIHEKTTPDEQPQFFISVPKRKFKRAVKRVWLRRRIREAYRLNKHLLSDIENKSVDMAFLYISGEKNDFETIQNRMKEILIKLNNSFKKQVDENN